MSVNKVKSAPGRYGIGVVIIGFLCWSWRFIYESSFITIDRYRSYSLFDDAMISMRYAWNFSHGYGLVWNQGEYVQGYTNLLMVLIMSFATLVLSKTMAVLAIQVSGVFFMLVIAYFNMQIAGIVFSAETGQDTSLLRVLAFLSGMAYYPLIYWSLMGMETGLLTIFLMASIFFALKYVRSLESRYLFLVAVLGGLAFLTRNDTILYFIGLWVYMGAASLRDKGGRHSPFQHLAAIGLYFIFIMGQLGFQYLYYGDLLPNTFVLKLTGMSFFDRVQNGLGFVWLFIKETALAFLLALTGFCIQARKDKALLFYLVVVSVLYQVYLGGDPWLYWRMMAPTMPLLLLLCIDAAFALVRRAPISNMSPSINLKRGLALMLIILGLVSMNFRFLSEISFRSRPYQVTRNARNVNTAIVLNDVLREDATVGVFWAGTIPYYVDNAAIDFLGKSDRYIANLPPDMSGAAGFFGMTSVPGHNKYDLTYSIVTLRPTYIPKLFYGGQDVSPVIGDQYVRVKYRYITLLLLKSSSDVNWEKLNLP